jgi:NADH:ubiquinone oxidoreductase subunit K
MTSGAFALIGLAALGHAVGLALALGLHRGLEKKNEHDLTLTDERAAR